MRSLTLSAISYQLSAFKLFSVSAFKLFSPLAFLLFAPCSLLLAQSIVPKRDMQPVDSLNRVIRGATPLTVIKKGYAHLSGDDGRYYHRLIIPYLLDTLRLDTMIGGGDWTDIGGSIYPTENDTVYIPDTFNIVPGTGILNVEGRFDLRFPTQSDLSIALGRNTLLANTTGVENLALGTDALFSNTEGSYNMALGHGALYFNTTGDNNLAIGASSQSNNTLGIGNVSLGAFSLFSNPGGIGNLAIGNEAGYGADGSNNIYIGNTAGYFATGDEQLHLDNSNTLTPLIYGDFAGDSIRINGHLGYTLNGGSPDRLAGRDGLYFSDIGPGPGLQIVDSELQIDPGGADSTFTYSDTICFIIMGDTTCVPWDSTYIDADAGEICFWVTPDTTCIPFSGDNINVYNSNGSLPSSTHRYFEIPQGSSLYFRKSNGSGVPFSFIRVGNPTSGQMLDIEGYTVAQSTPIIRMSNGNSSGNILMHYDGPGAGEDYAMGVDKATNSFRIAEGTGINGIAGFPMLSFHAEGDTVVANKDFKFWAGLRDHDGDLGTSGDILTSTGSSVDWVAPSAGGVAISALTLATATNDINNAAYQQDWRWNSLAGTSGLRLSSNSTAAASNLQKLFEVALSGANGTSSQTTYAMDVSNTHTGTGSQNIGIRSTASGAAINYGITSTVSGGTSLNYAVLGTSSGTNSIGVRGTTSTSSGIGVSGTASASGSTALQGSASVDNAVPIHGRITKTNLDDAHIILSLESLASGGNERPGFGGSIVWTNGLRSLSSETMNEISSTWSDTTYASRESALTIHGREGSTTQDIIYFEGDKRTRFNGRAQFQQGADVASVAGAITLGYDGNVFEITGTNAITLISNLGWQNGSQVTFFFTSTASLTDGTANSGTDIGMELAGGANFTASADDSITLILSEIGGTQRWRETSRSVN